MEITETLTQARDTAKFTADSLREAYAKINRIPMPPEGFGPAHRMQLQYLMTLIMESDSLWSKLRDIA